MNGTTKANATLADRMNARPLGTDVDGGVWYGPTMPDAADRACDSCDATFGRHGECLVGSTGGGTVLVCVPCAVADCERAERVAARGASFLAQSWNGQEMVAEVVGLSYDAACHVAQSFTLAGQTGRIMAETPGVDWCEVYAVGGNVRFGRFADTVLVRADHGAAK